MKKNVTLLLVVVPTIVVGLLGLTMFNYHGSSTSTNTSSTEDSNELITEDGSIVKRVFINPDESQYCPDINAYVTYDSFSRKLILGLPSEALDSINFNLGYTSLTSDKEGLALISFDSNYVKVTTKGEDNYYVIANNPIHRDDISSLDNLGVQYDEMSHILKNNSNEPLTLVHPHDREEVNPNTEVVCNDPYITFIKGGRAYTIVDDSVTVDLTDGNVDLGDALIYYEHERGRFVVKSDSEYYYPIDIDTGTAIYETEYINYILKVDIYHSPEGFTYTMDEDGNRYYIIHNEKDKERFKYISEKYHLGSDTGYGIIKQCKPSWM